MKASWSFEIRRRRQSVRGQSAVDGAGVVAPFERRRSSDDDDGTPAGALRRLLCGNRRFAQRRVWPAHRDRARPDRMQPSQAPFAAILGCSDAPVPPEMLFDHGSGALFVVQVAGNVVTPHEVASLEYAVAVLEVRAILVLGHTRCGAIEAARAGTPVEGHVSALFRHVAARLEAASTGCPHAEDNARAQRRRLLESSGVLRDRTASGKLIVTAAVHDIAAGSVRVVG